MIDFALGISQKMINTSRVNVLVQTQNNGLEDEVIITAIRHWLRQYEESYQERFKTSHS